MTKSPKLGSSAGNRGKGRPRGIPNKVSALLKDAIIAAATEAGATDGKYDGLVTYLKEQAIKSPGPFLALLGKVLPLQIAGDPVNPLTIVSKEQRDAAVAAFSRADA